MKEEIKKGETSETMKILITEHKSTGELRPAIVSNAVRVFVENDLHYGYFVDEHQLFEALTEGQRAAYLSAEHEVELDVSIDVAQRLIDIGATPYRKRALRHAGQ